MMSKMKKSAGRKKVADRNKRLRTETKGRRQEDRQNKSVQTHNDEYLENLT